MRLAPTAPVGTSVLGKRGREHGGEALFETAKRDSHHSAVHALVELDVDRELCERDDAHDAAPGRAGGGDAYTPTPKANTSRPSAPIRTYAQRQHTDAQRRLKYLLPASRRGVVARALNFGESDAPSTFFSAADEKAEVTIVVGRDEDAHVWSALERIEQLAPLLATLDGEVRLTRLRVETGTFEVEGAPQGGAFRTADDGLLAELRRRQWEPRWHALDAALLPLAPRPPASPASPSPAKARSLAMTEPMDTQPCAAPDAAAAADDDGDSGGVWEDLVDSDAPADELIEEACSDEREHSARGGSATSMPLDFSATPARALDGIVVRPTPVRATPVALDVGWARPVKQPVRQLDAQDPPPAAEAPTDGAHLARGEQLARGLAAADSTLANLFAMAAAVDAQYVEMDRALHADCEMVLCADYSDARLRALNAAFSQEDSRIGAFPPSGPIQHPFCAHLLIEAGAPGELGGIGYILHSGRSHSDDILPELHHVYIRASHRRRGHAMRMLKCGSCARALCVARPVTARHARTLTRCLRLIRALAARSGGGSTATPSTRSPLP